MLWEFSLDSTILSSMKHKCLTNHRNISIIQLLTYLRDTAPRNPLWPIPGLLPTLEDRKSCFNETMPMKHGAEGGTEGIRNCAWRESLWNMPLSSQGGLTGGSNRWLERKLKDQENSKAVGSDGSKQDSWKSQTSPCVPGSRPSKRCFPNSAGSSRDPSKLSSIGHTVGQGTKIGRRPGHLRLSCRKGWLVPMGCVRGRGARSGVKA